METPPADPLDLADPAVAAGETARRIEENKRRAVAEGQAAPVPEEVRAGAARARVLQIELAGFKTLAPATKANPNVAKTIHPKIREYVGHLMALATYEVITRIHAELGDLPAELLREVMEMPPEFRVDAPPAASPVPGESKMYASLRAKAEEAAERGDLAEVDRVVQLVLAARGAGL